MSEPTTQPPATEVPFPEVPEGIRKSLAAIRRDLPELLARRRNRGKCVLYHLDKRIAIGDYLWLIREANRLNIPETESVIDRIDENAGREEVDEIEGGSDWC